MGMGNLLRDLRRLMRNLWRVSVPMRRPFCAFNVPNLSRVSGMTRCFGAALPMCWRRREGTFSLVDWGGAVYSRLS